MNPFEFQSWCPRGVSHCIAAGASNYIAVVDEETVLKFPLVPPEEEDVYTTGGLKMRKIIIESAVEGLKVEEQILQRLGKHPRIIRLVEKHEDGLLLEYMANGSVENYLRHVAPNTSLRPRLKWARQAAEGLAYIHDKNVLHYDFSIGNLLLDKDLTLKICDFQGRLLDFDGSIILDEGAAESTTSSMPRPDPNICNRQTDMFTLGTAIYFMMTGQPPFPDLDPIDNEDEIQRRFKHGDFPPLKSRQGGDIIQNAGWDVTSDY